MKRKSSLPESSPKKKPDPKRRKSDAVVIPEPKVAWIMDEDMNLYDTSLKNINGVKDIVKEMRMSPMDIEYRIFSQENTNIYMCYSTRETKKVNYIATRILLDTQLFDPPTRQSTNDDAVTGVVIFFASTSNYDLISLDKKHLQLAWPLFFRLNSPCTLYYKDRCKVNKYSYIIRKYLGEHPIDITSQRVRAACVIIGSSLITRYKQSPQSKHLSWQNFNNPNLLTFYYRSGK